MAAKPKASGQSQPGNTETMPVSYSPAIPDGNRSVSAPVSRSYHQHVLTEHAHSGEWCSKRYRCEACRGWFDGPLCKGKRAALPALSSVALAR